MIQIAESAAVISGIGQSEIGRRLDRPAASLVADAALEAVADAELSLVDIDGVSTFPGRVSGPPGYSELGAREAITALGLSVSWYSASIEVPSPLAAVANAVLAVSGGVARHVLCFRVVTESTATASRTTAPRRASTSATTRAAGADQWTAPFGRATANWFGALVARYFHEFGATREQLAQVAIASRRNAARNPKAIFRDPLTLDEYMQARMISTPLCLYDCDVPVDAATALIVSRRDLVEPSRRRAIGIDAIGTAVHGPPSYDQYPDPAATAAFDAASMMWGRTTATADDLDLACLYDGFSWILISWLEALGLCGRGEGGSFIEDSNRGSGELLPINPHGGQLSAGRTHSFGFFHEACLQLRGDAGARQVLGRPRLAVVTNAGGPMAGCMLLKAE